jgi:hypothetical protein
MVGSMHVNLRQSTLPIVMCCIDIDDNISERHVLYISMSLKWHEFKGPLD